MKQTSVSWIICELTNLGYIFAPSFGHSIIDEKIKKAKEMEKQQIIDAYYGYELYLDREFRFQQGGQAKILTFDQWYETYRSKGSDEIEKSEKPINLTSSQTEISDKPHSTITDQIDGIIFEMPFIEKMKLWELINRLVNECQTEISDEEIAKQGFLHSYANELPDENAISFIQGVEWYREQLKKK